MSKRGPTTELNHDNWDQEDPKEGEEDMLGGFARATPEQLQNRVIRSAKRRSLHPSTSDSPKSPFTSFAGFGTQTASIPAKPSFTSFAGMGAGLKNGHGEQEKTKETDATPTVKGSTTGTSKKESNTESKSSSTKSSNVSTDYYTQLQGLNISVSKWISQHVNENPCCILTPVFRDYEKHLANIEKLKKSTDSDEADSSTSKQDDHQNKSSDSSDEDDVVSDKEETPASSTKDTPSTVAISSAVTTDSSSIKATPSAVSVDKNAANVEVQSDSAAAEGDKKEEESSVAPENQASKPPSFLQSPALGTASVFGSLKTTSGSLFGSSTNDGGFKPSGLTFSFGNNATPASNSSTFQFGSGSSIGMGGSTFSFAAQVAKATQQQAEKEAEEDQESEEPPKVEFQPVEEEGSVYSIKCKVFIKKDSEYKDRGVGMLYLKAAAGDAKAQLLVRTATTTGQILLNTLVTNDLRPARQGKNNVQIVCIPTPNESPAITLIRVKTGEDADELLTKIKEHTR